MQRTMLSLLVAFGVGCGQPDAETTTNPPASPAPNPPREANAPSGSDRRDQAKPSEVAKSLPGWIQHESEMGGFTVMLPGKPSVSPQKDQESGEVVGENIMSFLDAGMCQITHEPFSYHRIEPGTDADAIFEMKGTKWGASAVRQEKTTRSGWPAVIFYSDVDEGGLLHDMYVVGPDRIYQVRINGETTEVTPERTNAFFESFDLEESAPEIP